MHGAFCDQPRPENGPGYGPDLSCAVPGGDTAHTARTVRLPEVLRRCGTFPRYGEMFFLEFAGVEKNPRNAKKNAEIREFSSKREKKRPAITTLRPTIMGFFLKGLRTGFFGQKTVIYSTGLSKTSVDSSGCSL